MTARLILHSPNEECELPESYKRALTLGQEILIVSAYLTNWPKEPRLSSDCNRFRMIVGKDFGITRKAACRDVLAWLPKKHRVNFRVADQIDGFHPKAVFWRDGSGNCFAVIGSSNLSTAAFESNFEANVEIKISVDAFVQASRWVDAIAELSVPMSEDWLSRYVEATRNTQNSRRRSGGAHFPEVFPLKLPRPRGTAAALKRRRDTLLLHRRNRAGLIGLFRQCAEGRITSHEFYNQLSNHWGGSAGGKIQGRGWERRGSNSDFRQLAISFVAIMDCPAAARDDRVRDEIDSLARLRVPTRRGLLSEMLCLEFPDRYPLLNEPVQRFLRKAKFRGATGLSEGGRYIDIAQRLRLSLAQNPNHPAKNLAELDAVIWLADDVSR